MSTLLADIMVANLTAPTQWVAAFVVEVFSDSGLTQQVGSQNGQAAWNPATSLSSLTKPLVFQGLTYGATYYLRAGVQPPSGGSVVWSATYSVVAGSATAPVAALPTPGAATGTASTTGGTLSAATYFVKIVATSNLGTTQAGPESAGVATTGSTGSIAYTWAAVAGAVSYQIFVGTSSGAENEEFTSTSNSFTLTAYTAGTATPPSLNTSGIVFNGAFVSTTSGITFGIQPANVPSDVYAYEGYWTSDGTAPAVDVLPFWSGGTSSNSTASGFHLFVGGKPGDVFTVFVRAVNTSGLKQTWESLGSFTVSSVFTGTTYGTIGNGTTLGSGGAAVYGANSTSGLGGTPNANGSVWSTYGNQTMQGSNPSFVSENTVSGGNNMTMDNGTGSTYFQLGTANPINFTPSGVAFYGTPSGSSIAAFSPLNSQYWQQPGFGISDTTSGGGEFGINSGVAGAGNYQFTPSTGPASYYNNLGQFGVGGSPSGDSSQLVAFGNSMTKSVNPLVYTFDTSTGGQSYYSRTQSANYTMVNNDNGVQSYTVNPSGLMGFGGTPPASGPYSLNTYNGNGVESSGNGYVDYRTSNTATGGLSFGPTTNTSSGGFYNWGNSTQPQQINSSNQFGFGGAPSGYQLTTFGRTALNIAQPLQAYNDEQSGGASYYSANGANSVGVYTVGRSGVSDYQYLNTSGQSGFGGVPSNQLQTFAGTAFANVTSGSGPGIMAQNTASGGSNFYMASGAYGGVNSYNFGPGPATGSFFNSSGQFGVGGIPTVSFNVFGNGTQQLSSASGSSVQYDNAGSGATSFSQNNTGGNYYSYNSNASSLGYLLNSSGQYGLGTTTSNPLQLQGVPLVSPYGSTYGLSSSQLTPLTNSVNQPSGGTSPIASYWPSGTGVTPEIVVSAFTNIYPFASVAYNGGTISGLSSGTTYYVFCSDPGYLGGNVVWQASTNPQATFNQQWLCYVGSTTTPSTQSTSGTGTSGSGGTACTVEGVSIQTKYGIIPNSEIYRLWKEGELTTLSGRDQEEKIVNLEWVWVNSVYRVKVEGYQEFECSTSHIMLQRGYGIQRRISAVPVGSEVWTKTGWKKILDKELTHKHCRVLRVSLAGPSHEYWVEEGVWTHNFKPTYT